MAFGKRFEASFQSYNKTDYYFCVWVDGYAGATVEMKIGTGGPKLSYETDDESRFNPILASTLSVPFVVDGAVMESFISDILDTYEEKQVWMSLYKNTSATGKPIFNGYVIMDLGAREDVSYPYDVTVTATDGLALLKDADFVESTATLPYDSADMYWGPASFVYWVGQILQKTGQNDTDITTALGVSPTFSTSIDWYNANSGTVGVTNDPFENTRGKMSWTHSQDSQGRFQVMNSYEVLKAIMKAWGCRIVYWQHNFYIVQISQYTTANTGNLSAPVNIDTRYYKLTGASTGVQNLYLGENLNTTRYDLQFDLSSMAGTTPSQGLQKLAGTKYDYYSKVHKVTADFISGGGRNYFTGFPFYDGTTLPIDVAQEFAIDFNYATNLLLQIPLKAQMTYYGTNRVVIYFQLKATNGVTTKYLKDNGSSAFTWVSSPPSFYPNGDKPSIKYEITGTAPQEVMGFDHLLPTDAAFTGQWTFTLQVDSSNWGNSTSSEFTALDPIGGSYGTVSGSITKDPSTNGHTWSNVPNLNFGNSVSNQNTQLQYQNTSGNQFEGSFLSINSTFGVNQFGQNVYIETNTSDSDVYRFGELQYGDTLDGTDDAALQTYNGSSWTVTDFTGEWGTGTLAGTSTFTEMLVNDFLEGQLENIFIINTTTALSVNDKTDSFSGVDYLKYVNPIGRIFENNYYEPPRFYIFKRGVWIFAKDEVEYEGFETKSGTPTITTNTDRKYYKGEPIALDDGGPMPRVMQTYDNSKIAANNVFLSQTTQDTTGVTTTLNISEIGVAVFNSGDKISLFDKYGIKSFELTLTADQVYDATTLSISSYDFGTEVIEKGALISYSKYELTKNHNLTSPDKTKFAFNWGLLKTPKSPFSALFLNGPNNTAQNQFGTAITLSTLSPVLSPYNLTNSGIMRVNKDCRITSANTISNCNTNGFNFDLDIYKGTPVDGSTANVGLTKMGTFTLTPTGSSASDLDAYVSALLPGSDTISAGDVVIPALDYTAAGSGAFKHFLGITTITFEYV